VDTNEVSHGFLLTNSGGFTEFDAPNAGMGPFSVNLPAGNDGLSDQGAVAGYFYDDNSVPHGFLRAPDGTFSEFDAPDSLETYVYGLNSQQTVVGLYITSEGAGLGGFLRTVDGKIETILLPLNSNSDSVLCGANWP
jgi:hypothetical protein